MYRCRLVSSLRRLDLYYKSSGPSQNYFPSFSSHIFKEFWLLSHYCKATYGFGMVDITNEVHYLGFGSGKLLQSYCIVLLEILLLTWNISAVIFLFNILNFVYCIFAFFVIKNKKLQTLWYFLVEILLLYLIVERKSNMTG